jgi:hypothetical protein
MMRSLAERAGGELRKAVVAAGDRNQLGLTQPIAEICGSSHSSK